MARRRFSEWTSTGKTWPLTATLTTIIVSVTFLIGANIKIDWLSALVGLPLLCFAMTGLLYKLMFPGFRRNTVTNLLAHLLWTAAIAAATSLITTLSFHWEVLLAIVPVGLIASGITHGKSKTAAYAYAGEIMATFVYVAVLTFVKIFPMTTVMVFLTVPIAVGCSKTIINSVEGGAHLTKDLGARTANLLHMYSALLAVAFAVARFI